MPIPLVKEGSTGWGSWNDRKASPVVLQRGMAARLKERLGQLKALDPAEDPFAGDNSHLIKGIDGSGIGCFVVDAHTNEAQWSLMVYVLHDLEPSGNRQKDRAALYAKIHPDDRANFVDTRERAIAAGTGSYDVPYRILWRDGTVLRVLAHWDIVGSREAGDLRLVGTIYDLTDLWRLQQQETEHLLVKKTLDEERKRREEVQRLLRTTSHEVRGPLQGIMSNVRLLLDKFEEKMEDGDGQQPVLLCPQEAALMRSCLEDTVECATHQLLCINDFLDEVAQAKERLVRSEPVAVDAVIASVASMFKTGARDKGITLSCVATPEKVVVVSDGVLLKRVLMNLVSNAVKFANEGTITISVKHDGADLSVQVADEGRGVPPEFRDKLFYETGLTTTSQDFVGGSGLGLCICRHLVEELQGTIGFYDNTPRGTVFIFTVPALRVEMTPSPPLRGRQKKPESDYLRERSILVAEDNRINQRVLRHMLEPLAGKVTIANDGLEALQLFKQEAYDLVMLDIHMPRMSGSEAAAALRSGAWTMTGPPIPSSVPIIFLTGEIASDVQKKVAAIQPCILLLKPASVTDIVDACKQLLPPPHTRYVDPSAGSRSASPETKYATASQTDDDNMSAFDRHEQPSLDEDGDVLDQTGNGYSGAAAKQQASLPSEPPLPPLQPGPGSVETQSTATTERWRRKPSVRRFVQSVILRRPRSGGSPVQGLALEQAEVVA